MKNKKLILLAIVALAIGSFLLFGPREIFSLEYVQARLGAIQTFREENPLLAILIFCGGYILIVAASIPGAVIITLVGGAVFGFWLGTLLVVFSATVGATIAFLLSRYLFDDLVKARMGERLGKIRERFREEGALYLFSLRLVPVFPFFMINLLMGLTSIRTLTFAGASFVGMAPGSMVFVNAGTQLSKLESVGGLLSPKIIVSFLLLAIFPYIAKYAVRVVRGKSPDKNGSEEEEA